jgi:hypothetical protein
MNNMVKDGGTTSETLFLSYCGLRGYEAKRIPAMADRHPDYDVLVGNARVIVEIKELQPNAQDMREAEAFQQRHHVAFTREPGRRVRTHIEDAERQLRRYEGQKILCVVVLYDNIVINGFRLHPDRWLLSSYDIDVGMYGLQAANLRLYPDGRTESLGDTRGGQRTLRHMHQASISAVAVLHDYAPDYGLFLMIYHNFYAQNPLPRSVFTNQKDRQLVKPDDPELSPGAWSVVQG